MCVWINQVTQDLWINGFHIHSLKKLIGISWKSRTPSTDVLFECGIIIMFTVLRQHRLRWLVLTCSKNENRKNLQKYLVWIAHSWYAQSRAPQFCYQDVFRRNMIIDLNKWEELAMDDSKWKSYFKNSTSCLLYFSTSYRPLWEILVWYIFVNSTPTIFLNLMFFIAYDHLKTFLRTIYFFTTIVYFTVL